MIVPIIWFLLIELKCFAKGPTSHLESIIEAPLPTTSSSSQQPGASATAPTQPPFLPGTVEPPQTSYQQMFRRGRVTTPNTYAAQLRVINNVRMQHRATRYSMKRQAINSIVDMSNYQRLVSGIGGPELAAAMMMSAPPSAPPADFTATSEKTNVITIGLTGKKGHGAARNGGSATVGSVAQVLASGQVVGAGPGGVEAVVIQQQSVQRPNPIMINAIFPGIGNGGDIDFKIFQYKKQQAELKRNQLEDDLKVIQVTNYPTWFSNNIWMIIHSFIIKFLMSIKRK